MLNKFQLQNLDQPLCSKSEQKISFMPKYQLPNQQAVANMILSINISNSKNLDRLGTWANCELERVGSDVSCDVKETHHVP